MFTRMREGKPRWQNPSARVRPDIGRWSFEEISPAYQNNSLRSTNGPFPVPETPLSFSSAAHNEPLSVTMRVHNPDRSSFKI
jgi:hypothetical protein